MQNMSRGVKNKKKKIEKTQNEKGLETDMKTWH